MLRHGDRDAVTHRISRYTAANGWEYATDLTHLPRRNPATGLCGAWATPTAEIQTFCRLDWPDDERPRRSMLPEHVTCEACKAAPPAYVADLRAR